MLPVLEDGNEVKLYDKGKFRVQVEIPSYSTLTGYDIDRIGEIASWQYDINERIDDVGGGRSVIIGKKETSYSNNTPLGALEIGGVGYVPYNLTNVTAMATADSITMRPPSSDNFRRTKMGKKMRTSTIINGKFAPHYTPYEPLGSYLERQMLDKVKKTRLASSFKDVSFSVPNVEAYGRYLDMMYDGEHLAFCVFSIPDKTKRLFSSILDSVNKMDIEDFEKFMEPISFSLGAAASDIHKNGFVHRQMHLSNYYAHILGSQLMPYVKLHVMDWATLLNLDEVSPYEKADYMSLDIRIPQQNIEAFLRGASVLDEFSDHASISFLVGMFLGYFGEKINVLDYVTTRINDDRAVIANVIRSKKNLP